MIAQFNCSIVVGGLVGIAEGLTGGAVVGNAGA